MGTSNSIGEGGSFPGSSSASYWREHDPYHPFSAPSQPAYPYSSCNRPPTSPLLPSGGSGNSYPSSYVSPAARLSASGAITGHKTTLDSQFAHVDFRENIGGLGGRGCGGLSADTPFRTPSAPSGGCAGSYHAGTNGALRDRHFQPASFHVSSRDYYGRDGIGGHDYRSLENNFQGSSSFPAQLGDASTDRQLTQYQRSFAEVGHHRPHPSQLLPGSRAVDTLLIFDWDDTLMCSSAINANQFLPHQYAQLEALVEQVLVTSMRLGETCIVTNADELWVHESTRQFLPRVMPLLSQMQVTSARRRHEACFPGDIFAWKRETFREVLAVRPASAMLAGGTNLVVLGDSLAEMEAAHSSSIGLPSPPTVKTVKFKDAPSVEELLEQLRIVSQELDVIVAEEKGSARDLVHRIRPGLPALQMFAPQLGVSTYASLPMSTALPQLGVPMPPASYAGVLRS
eukprot:TRINITY_DN15074_c0_g1_i1.p1 TRINITY_DN15074_c0_g1~~TRINITY_DN15074_c0_g1_i1.p1  ORF type:complete len:465 (-),score=62.09 TRINITY_DN15074_c0_g1_i1:199-1566(-)